MKLACGLVLTHFKTIKYSKVERPAYSLHHCAVLKNTYFRHWADQQRCHGRYLVMPRCWGITKPLVM